MTNPNLGEGTSTYMENYSSQVDMSELGACCLDLLPSASTSKFEAATMHSGMLGPEIDCFKEKTGKNSTDYYSEYEKLINSIEQTNDLEETIKSLELDKPVVKNTFEDETIDYQYGSVIRDADIALKEVESQPGTTKSIKMIEYYSKQCPFILSLLKQDKTSCIANEKRFLELQKAEDCLEKLAKCFADKQTSSCKK